MRFCYQEKGLRVIYLKQAFLGEKKNESTYKTFVDY